MSGVDVAGLRERIRFAKETVASAQGELDAALRQLESPDRAEKTMISEVLRHALEKLSTARLALEKAEDSSAD